MKPSGSINGSELPSFEIVTWHSKGIIFLVITHELRLVNHWNWTHSFTATCGHGSSVVLMILIW